MEENKRELEKKEKRMKENNSVKGRREKVKRKGIMKENGSASDGHRKRNEKRKTRISKW